MQALSEESSITGINVTPLVDILLVVLIIFMATAPMISNRAIKVDIPKAARHERTATEALQIAYNGKRELFLSGKKVDLPELTAALARKVALAPNLHVTFSADKALAYGEIVAVLDVIRTAGVRKIGLEVQRK